MITAMIVYQEARMLPLALGHLPDCDLLVVDGAYADFPHEVPWSTDGTVEIAKRRGAQVIEVTEPWPDQVAKRTATLIPGRVVFVLDADELLHTELPVLPDGVDVGWVKVISPIYAEPYFEPRVFRVREGWHYAGRHHWIYDGERQLVASHRQPGAGYRHIELATVIENRRDWRESARHGAKQLYGKARNRQELRHKDERSLVPRSARR